MNISPVVPFYFNSNEVRTTLIDGQPWFVAKDVCNVLDISDHFQACDKLDEDERGRCLIPTPSGQQEMLVVSESGFYVLILRCRDAVTPGTTPYKFRKWVTSEVLPSIRKTGTYTRTTSRPPLWPDAGHGLAIAKTREGEIMARELTIGVKVARAIGLHGRRQILEHAADLVDSRTGCDPLEYFGVKLEKHFPKVVGNTECIGKFIEREIRICPATVGMEKEPRIKSRVVYDRFVKWYGEAIDERLRFLPSIIAVSKELFRRGAGIRKIGGTSYICGVEFINGGSVGSYKEVVQ